MARLIALLALFILPFATSSLAQDGVVDCGNGFHCPKGNACLLEGFCAVVIDAVPGSVPSSVPGYYCEPGFRESKGQPGKCIPDSYIECPNGSACAAGMQCAPAGGCTGGSPTGPMCGGIRCVEGRVCSSRSTCLNLEYFKDCGNGTICTKGAACEQGTGASGCVLVAPERTRQQSNSPR